MHVSRSVIRTYKLKVTLEDDVYTLCIITYNSKLTLEKHLLKFDYN